MLNLFKRADIVQLTGDGEHYIVRFPEDEERKERLKQAVPGAKWDSREQCYYAPATWESARKLAISGFSNWTQEAKDHARAIRSRELRRIESSASSSAELDLAGFGIEPFPFQKAGIAYGLERKRVIIGDQMGLGKTIQALGIVHVTQAFPCLIITPASLKYNWAEREVPRALADKTVVVADKSTGSLALQMADVIVTNYEQLVGFRTYESLVTEEYTDDDGNVQCRMIKKKRQSSWKDSTKKEVVLSPLAAQLQYLGLRSIICDEAHYLKEPGAARTHAAKTLRLGVEYRLLLTGTAMLNRPAELFSLLQFLDRSDEFGGWLYFMQHYCGLARGKFGPEAKRAFHSDELNRKLRASCYVRRLKKDVLTELPDKLRTCYQIEIDNRAEYDHAEKELVEWVKARVFQDKEFLNRIADLPDEQRQARIRERQTDKAEAAARAEEIVRFQALKNITARGKLKTAREWINNFLESGEKLVVFVTGRDIQAKLLAWYPEAARIVAADDAHERQRNVQRFQEDENCRLIICAQGTSAVSSPGGVGHTLTAASNVLTLELGWNNALHDQCEDRCHRIGQRDTVNCHYLLGARTVEIDIAELIESKRATSKRVLDGGEYQEEESILNELKDRLVNR